MSVHPDSAVAALQIVAADFDVSAEVEGAVASFEQLKAPKSSWPALRSALGAEGRLSEEELEELFGRLESHGYGGLDFFDFALQYGVPQSAVSAAERRAQAGGGGSARSGAPSHPQGSSPRRAYQAVKGGFGGGGSAAGGGAAAAEEKKRGGTPRGGSVSRSFAKSLIHQFPLVSQQVESGLYSVKRVAAYLKKVCGFEESYSREVLRATNHETSKLEKVQGDGMKRYINTWIGLQEVVYQMATQHAEFRNKVMTAVVMPLTSFHREAEQRRKELLSEMRNISAQMKQVNDVVKKAKKRAWELLTAYKQSHDRDLGLPPSEGPDANAHGEAGGDGFSFKKFRTQVKAKLHTMAGENTESLKTKSADACLKYKQAIIAANARRLRYRQEELPRVFTDMQNLEIARLDVLKEHLTKFSLIYHEMVSPLEELSTRMVQNVGAMDTNSDVDDFVDMWVSVHGEPPVYKAAAYDLPATHDDLSRGRWDFSLESKENRNSIFGTTLTHCMQLQAKKYPRFKIPVILDTLTSAIRKLNGPAAEGIFRISPSKSELDSLRRQFDSGNYDAVQQASSPHVPAALLKEWLRTLSEPVIPSDSYQQCIDVVKDREDAGVDEVMAVYRVAVPPLSARVIESVVALLADVVRNQETSRMSVENCAIVFSPAFLRSDSDDPMMMLMNSKHETGFTTLLIRGIMRQQQ